MRARLLTAVALFSAIPLFASIRGTVMTTDGQPVAGAKVSVFALESSGARRTRLVSKTPDPVAITSGTTDSKGSFVLESPKDPVVMLQIDARGYAPEGVRVERDEEAVVAALRTITAKQGTISANGKPVAGAKVVWSSGAAEVDATTDAAGHYSVPDPSRWALSVIVIHPDFAPLNEMFGGRAKAELNFSLDPGVPITGKIVNGTTGVPNATVLVDGWPSGTTNDDGTFSIAHAPKKWEIVGGATANLIASRARTAANTTLKASPASIISGTIRDAKTQQPVAGAEVSFAQQMARGMRIILVSAISDAKGAFTTPITPGVYQIFSTHPGYAIEPMNISASAGQHVQKALAAKANARIVGTVVDEQKRGIAAANVVAEQATSPMRGMRRVMNPRGGGGVFSGPDGRFTVRTADEGDLELTASRKGLPEGRSSIVRVASGDRKSGITITIPQGVALTGRVIDHDGKPVSGVTITSMEAENSGGGRPGGAVMRRMILGMAPSNGDGVMTGTDGRFSLRVKEGTYDVKFAREGFAAKTLRGQQVTATTKPLEVTMEPGVEITGRVVRSGNGIEGVNVSAIDADSQSYVTTTSDGHFTLPDLTPGTYMVNIAKPDEFIQQMRSLTAPARDLVIEIPAGGRISGHVIDKSTHEPVTSFQAGINPSRSGGGLVMMFQPQLRSFTSDDGSFALDNVPAGALQLVVSAPGYTTAHVPSINVEEGKSVADIEVALETGVRLVGHVSGPNGAPAAGVSVRPGGGGMRLPAGMPGPPGQTAAVTDANGDYSIDELEPGDNKSFTFSASGYLPLEKTTNLSGKETRLDAQLSGGMTVTGMVVTEGGVPVPDADVRASSAAAGSTTRMGKTDASGTFALDTVAPGRYIFTASKNGFAEGELTDFDVSGGASPRIVLKSGGTLTGHVSGVTDADLSKVTVMVRGANGSSEAAVDAGGNYRLDGAPTGTLRVSASLMRGFGDVRTTDTKTVDLAAGGTAQLDLTFTSNTVIRGRVTRNGVPASNSALQFNPRGAIQTRASASTDDAGNYSVSGLGDGDYTVTVVDMQRLSPYSTTYTVHGSGSFDIDVKTSTLRGHVIDRGDSTPISSARVQLRRTDIPNAMVAQGVMSDDSGTFVLDNIAAGTYSVSAEKDGYGNVVKDITVSDTAPQDVMLDLVRNDGVTLKVVDQRDGSTLNGMVSVFDAQNRPVYSSMRFGGSDTLRIPLATGQYRATVSATGYAPKSVNFTSPSTQTVALTPGGTLIIRSKGAVVQRAILVDSSGTPYQRPFAMEATLSLAPGETRLQNVNPGAYTLQILGPNGAVASTKSVVIVEGREAVIDL